MYSILKIYNIAVKGCKHGEYVEADLEVGSVNGVKRDKFIFHNMDEWESVRAMGAFIYD